ncbi:hypothetical protein [Rhodopirellula bahusiensis]|uniref:Uncharacterized protein n=1 Tax=Rhodopirellula bahusiensis TaxID=2014065 RepID=A0A2G1W4U2_9BACT|nr:hypothetical protein [Rhodopirellula bahusiensis]PHQ34046.1 hypothetical protein CEE69_17270 [Rhodopirellula bahusiensis]
MPVVEFRLSGSQCQATTDLSSPLNTKSLPIIWKTGDSSLFGPPSLTVNTLSISQQSAEASPQMPQKLILAKTIAPRSEGSHLLRERMKNRMLLKQHAVKVWKQAEWIRSLS